MKKCRVGMIVEAQFPPDIRVEREALTLIDKGYEVHVLCMTHQKKPFIENYKGIIIHRFSLSKLIFKKLSPLALTFPFYFQIWEKPVKLFLELGFQIIHLHDLPLLNLLLHLKQKFSFKLIVDLHENRPVIMKYYSHVKKFPGKYLISIKKWENYQRKLVPQVDHVIVVTDLAKQQLVADILIDQSKLTSICNFVDVEKFIKTPIDNVIVNKLSNKWNIVYVGVTGLRRGIDVAIQAVAAIKDRIPNMQFIVLGSSRDDYLLRKLTIDLHIETMVYFTGWVPQEKINSYIFASHVGISPIRRNPHHDTTLANKISQYLAYKKPIIVSDCLMQASIVAKFKCGLVYEDGNISDLADKLIKSYSNKKLYHFLAENTGKASKELDWKIEANKLEKIYEELL